MKNALIIFVRKPVLGKVKTRLAATMGNEKALHVYKKLLQHTYTVAANTDADKFIFYHNEIEQHDLWNGPRFYKALQNNDDLGGKMKHAFEQIFNKGYTNVVIIGSDCFEITTAIVMQAFNQLTGHGAVIGPAKDGGYYLLGIKKMMPAIFKNKNWSTETVYQHTINDFTTHAIEYYALPTLTDVDKETDIPHHFFATL
jgi:uncharacterized protein